MHIYLPYSCGPPYWAGQNSFPETAGLQRLRKAGMFFRLISNSFPSQFNQLSDPPRGPLFLIGNMQTFEYLREYNDLESLGIADPAHVRCIYSADISANKGPMMWREQVRLSAAEAAQRRLQ